MRKGKVMAGIDGTRLVREVVFTASRSGGPGGQNVNKVSSKATLAFDVRESEALSEGQKARLFAALAGRISARGILRVVCQTQRSYERNRERATERFLALVEEALRPRKRRRATAPTMASHERRIEGKKRRSSVKRERAAGKKSEREGEG